MGKNRHGSAVTTFVSDREVMTQRVFDAPIYLVFDALTLPEHLREWFSADRTPLHVCEIDLRVGGKYHFAWYAPDGVECSFRGAFTEIERPARLVQTWLFEGWPNDEAINTVTLTEANGVTTMTDALRFESPENLGDHFQGDTTGVQTGYDQLEDLLTGLL